jgi:hypothetical protein
VYHVVTVVFLNVMKSGNKWSSLDYVDTARILTWGGSSDCGNLCTYELLYKAQMASCRKAILSLITSAFQQILPIAHPIAIMSNPVAECTLSVTIDLREIPDLRMGGYKLCVAKLVNGQFNVVWESRE